MVVESYVIIEKIIEDSCEQTMEFASKNQKGKPCEMDSPLLKNDITRFFWEMIRAFYSSNMQSGSVTGSLETSEILTIEFTRRNWVASNNDLPQLHGKIGNGK